MNVTFKRILVFGLFIFSSVSCSKKVDTPTVPPIIPFKGCHIIAASDLSPVGDTLGKYLFTYYEDGKLSGSHYENSNFKSTTTYTYSGKKIYRVFNATTYSFLDTITLNDAGFMIQQNISSGGALSTSSYLYDSQMQLTTAILQDSSFYTFTNGDNTLIRQGPFTDTLVYDLNKPAVAGNLDEFFQSLNTGATTIKNKHLLIAKYSGDSTKYSYTYNGDGNISSIKFAYGNSGSSTLAYTYECK